LKKTQIFGSFTRPSNYARIEDIVRETIPVRDNNIWKVSFEGNPDVMLVYAIEPVVKIDMLPRTIIIHWKRETNTFYTINAINTLVANINNGVVEKNYPLEWDRYENFMLLCGDEGLTRTKILGVELL
jgi:hypothetical protein